MSKLKKKECLYYLEKNRFGILAVCLNNEPFTYLIKYDLDYFNGYVTLSFKLKKNSKLISILKSNNNVAIDICFNNNTLFNNEVINLVAVGSATINEEQDIVVVNIMIDDIYGNTGLSVV